MKKQDGLSVVKHSELKKWLARVNESVTRGEYAAEVCQQAIAEYPSSAELWNSYGEVLERLNRLADAQLAFTQSLTLNPENARAWNSLGVIFRKLEKDPHAEEAFQRSIAIDSNFPNPHFNIRDLELSRLKSKSGINAATDTESGIISKSQRNYDRELRLKHCGDLEEWLSLAKGFFADGEPYRAAKIVEKAAEVNSGRPDIWLKHVGTLEQLGQHHVLERILRNAVKQNPDNIEAWNWLGVREMVRGRSDRAVTAFTNTARINPADPHCRILALLLDACGQTQASIEVLKNSLSGDLPATGNWNLLGVLQHKIGRLDEAQSSFRKGLECGIEKSFIYNNLGRILEDRNDDDGALEAFDAAVSVDKTNAVAWNNLGVLLRKKQFDAEAEKAFRIAIAIAPFFSNPWLNLKDLALSRGGTAVLKKEEARPLTLPIASKWTKSGWSVYDEEHLSKQLVYIMKEVATNNVDGLYKLALGMFNARQYQDCHQLLSVGLERYKDSSPLWHLNKMVTEKLGDISEAINCYQKALENDSSNMSASYCLLELKLYD